MASLPPTADPVETPSPDGQDALTGRSYKGLFWILLLLGIAVLAAAAVWSGVDDIAKAFAAGGFALVVLTLFHPLYLIPAAMAWKVIFPERSLPRRGGLTYATWIGQSVDLLLPLGNIGAEFVKARLVMARGTDFAAATASVVADKTVQAITAVALLLLAILFMALRSPSAEPMWVAAGVTLLITIGVFGFIRWQRRQGVSRLLQRLLRSRQSLAQRAGDGAQEIEALLEELYRHPGRLAWSTVIRLISVVLLSAEIWVAGMIMGLDISLYDAVTIRIVGFAARSAAFFIAGGIGVQEATYAVVGAMCGLPAASLIAISLATRVRELAWAIPGLTVWLTGEGLKASRK